MSEASVYPSELDDRLPRCCPSHPDWPTLAQHLLDDFPEVNISVLIRELSRARDATEHLGIDGPEALHTAELITRHQLLLVTGQAPDIARLDPERHVPRS